MQLSVDEVILTFHATDAYGLPINDLTLGEIKIFDKGIPPRRIVAFDSLIDRPVRAGILLDTSESMQQALPESKSIAERYPETLQAEVRSGIHYGFWTVTFRGLHGSTRMHFPERPFAPTGPLNGPGSAGVFTEDENCPVVNSDCRGQTLCAA